MFCGEVAMMFFMLGVSTGALGFVLAEAYRVGMLPKVISRSAGSGTGSRSPYFDEQEWFQV